METSFDLLAWRATLAGADRVPLGHDMSAWSKRLAAAGAGAMAELLDDVAALHRGFHRRPLRAEEPAEGDLHRPIRRSMMERAADELRGLASDVGAEDPPSPPAKSAPPRPGGQFGAPGDLGGSAPAPPAVADVASVARALRRALESEPGEGSIVAAGLADGLLDARSRLPDFDYRTFVHAPLELLVPAIATAGLIDWARTTRDLTRPPLGSPGLLHRAARLADAGLGSYFRNVGRLIRDTADLFDLARIAAQSTAPAHRQERMAAWAVLLSRGCGPPQLRELVDELGDLGASEALSVLIDRAAACAPAADIEIVLRVRDAALDNVDYPLAVRAQRLIARLRPESRLEGVILGDVEASSGDFARAEAIYLYWLDRSPDDRSLRARLLAAQNERFDEFAVTRGYGSPADRQAARLRRRGVPPDYVRRRGERMEAVDVR